MSLGVWTLVAAAWAAMAVVMFALWLVQLRTRNAGPVDIAWTLGLGAAAAWYALGSAPLPATRRWIVAALVVTWSLRLGVYLIHRVGSEAEDGRYQRLRRGWGPSADHFFFWFFQAQALFVVLFSVPCLVAIRNPAAAPSPWDLLGVAVFLAAAAGEALADRQLSRFRRDPANRGRTCRAGLWRYSRHPNYFFQWLHWWAYVLLAVGSGWWWLTLIGPAAMLYLILYVTGIPYTEEQALRSRGDDYRAYQRETSAFIPWFPRTGEASA